MAPNYEIVFVVLVYRNTKDLDTFFNSLQVGNCKVIVVNSYYDDESESIFKDIAQKNNADFLSVPNKGYGAGNNRGIEWALSNYDFKFLVVSNADILIEKFSVDLLLPKGEVIIAPKIINLRNRNQNPSTPFTPLKLSWKLWKIIYDRDLRVLSGVKFAWSRFLKMLFYLISPWNKRCFSAHGAFVIFPKVVLEKLEPVYNEQMFLFVEEEHLGMLAASKFIKTIYAPDIVVKHKENGSMSIASVNEFERKKQSFAIFYDYWFDKGL